ncbi:uncharacterized protein LOC110190309 [Drosophila serrata]|uniref:uncharacterized protein LOC110190309 n=1 Tax=Drosophila serrata TaxID=7274 RepID=UPI000A1D07DF|nr:uncharacterized protein LOC110190309 [Drosophila serrata]
MTAQLHCVLVAYAPSPNNCQLWSRTPLCTLREIYDNIFEVHLNQREAGIEASGDSARYECSCSCKSQSGDPADLPERQRNRAPVRRDDGGTNRRWPQKHKTIKLGAAQRIIA